MRPRTQDVYLKNSLHLLWILNSFCCLSEVKNFWTKRLHIVAAILDITVYLKNSLHLLWTLNSFCCLSEVKNFEQSDFTSWLNYAKGTGDDNLNELPPPPTMFVRCLFGKVPTMNREKGGRHNHLLDKWLKEFGWLQTRGSRSRVDAKISKDRCLRGA